MRQIKIMATCILLCALFAGCGQVPAESQPSTTGTQMPAQNTTEATEVPTTQPTTLPEPTPPPEISPDVVGIYIPAADGTKARKLVTSFQASRVAKQDIDCFEILASDQERIDGTSFAGLWQEAWNAHSDNQNTKIGFHIEFQLASGEVVSKMLLKPSDSESFYEYLEIYMYDDIHVTPGVWYTHLEDRDMMEETIVSSIKLTSGSKIEEVRDITLTAFLYTDECFNEAGEYIGLVSASIVITE